MKSDKKSQTTIFIILGIVILFAIGLLIYIKVGILPKPIIEDEELKEIKNYVDECVKETASDGLKLMGKQNGIELKDYIATEFSSINYAYNGSIQLLPIKDLQNQLSVYITANLPTCINDFEAFEGWNINSGRIKAETTFAEKSTIVKLSYKVTLTGTNSKKELKEFRIELPVRVNELHKVIETMVNKRMRGINYIELKEYLGTLKSINSYILDYDDTKLFALEDIKSVLDNKPYVFFFAMK